MKMDFDFNFLMWTMSYFIISFTCVFYFIRKSYFAYLLNNVLWFKFVLIPAYILAEGKFLTSFGFYISDSFIEALIVSLFFIFVINIAILFSPKSSFQLIHGTDQKLFSFERHLYYIMFICFTAVVLVKLLTVPDDLSNRLIENSGKGYLHILGYLGYFLAFYFLKDGVSNKKRFILAISIAFYGGVFFLLLGYRGGFLYSPILVAVFLIVTSRKSALYVMSLPILLLLLFEINYVTSTVRYLIVTGTEIDYQNFIDFYSDYKSRYTVPLAFNHFEYVAYWISTSDAKILLLGSWNTVYSSLFNWIPSVLLNDKPLTTGPTLGILLFPDVISSSGRTSSLTTGVIFEFIYNFGLILAGPFLFIFFYSIHSVINISKSTFYQNPWILIGFYWLFGFSMFFDDLGGTINKFIILCATFLLIRVFKTVLPSSK